MSDKRNVSFSEQILNEIWGEISLLEGRELDEFLSGIGLDPDELLQHYKKSAEGAAIAAKRSRFEEARRHIREQKHRPSSNVISMDVTKKRQILAVIRDRTSQTKDMTVAARNQKIDAEKDLDSFLEACIRLGVIDEDGNLKE